MAKGRDQEPEAAVTSCAGGGYTYYVSDEQMDRFAQLTPYQRLQWLDEARLFTLMTETPETRERRERLRRGLPIIE